MTVPLPGHFKRMSLTPSGVRINTLVGGEGSPVLLLHGYPQTHIMWHHVAPILAEHHTVVLTDLRGYGDSGKPAGGHNHEAYAKRAMARDQVLLMHGLGFDEFAVVGHDRGARVGHRMALDYPQAVAMLAVLDIVPTRHAFQNATREFGLGYWHWFFLAQPEPLPEHLLGLDPDGWIRGRMSALRRGGQPFDPRAMDEYVRCFRDPATIHASCEDYRAAAGTDLADDDASVARGETVAAPLLALWGEHGFVGRHYDVLAVWREYADKAVGRALPCGHYLPEEVPLETAAALLEFLQDFLSERKRLTPKPHHRSNPFRPVARSTAMRTTLTRWLLRVSGAGLLAASAAIHLDLYLTGYRSIPTIGWLFLVQVIVAFVLAAAVLAAPLVLSWPSAADAGLSAAGAGFSIATLGGYLLSLWVGLFGFREIRTTAGVVAGVFDIAAFAALAALAALIAGAVLAALPASRSTSGAVASRLATIRRLTAPAIGVVSVAAIALFGASVAANGGSSASVTASGSTVLRTTTIGGISVLTNASGRTLYWFAPDTPGHSVCYGECAAYWPPVTGTPTAGPGVTLSKIGTIVRTGGAIQVTYSGHPLYTYIGDTGPGQASGNNINLNGGVWHEVPATG